MTREELAAELYELIVNKARRHGKPRTDNVFGNSFEELPPFMQEMWLDSADEFAGLNNIKLVG